MAEFRLRWLIMMMLVAYIAKTKTTQPNIIHPINSPTTNNQENYQNTNHNQSNTKKLNRNSNHSLNTNTNNHNHYQNSNQNQSTKINKSQHNQNIHQTLSTTNNNRNSNHNQSTKINYNIQHNQNSNQNSSTTNKNRNSNHNQSTKINYNIQHNQNLSTTKNYYSNQHSLPLRKRRVNHNSPPTTTINHNSSGHPPAREVAHMLGDVMENNLPGCYKVLIFDDMDEHFKEVAQATVDVFGDDGVVMWDVYAFLTTPPPPPHHTLITHTHHKAKAELCVAFILLDDLQGVGETVVVVQRAGWYEGAKRLVLAYTGGPAYNLITQTTHHHILGSSYNTVITGWLPPVSPSSPRTYPLLTPCPYCRQGQPQVTQTDLWRPGIGQVKGSHLYPDSFKNFHGHTFNIATLEYAPFSCYDIKPPVEGAEEPEDNAMRLGMKGPELILKDCIDTRLVNVLAKAFNFSYVVWEPKDKTWGGRLPNGSYTGVIGAVQKYAADFSLNVAMTGERERAIDYTIGYFSDPLTFCTSRPRPINQALALIKPFQPSVWGGFVLALMVIGPFYYLTCFPITHKPPISLTSAFLDIYGACLTQSRRWVKSFGSRVVVATWMLFSLVTMTSYVAMLTASFTLPTLSPTLNSLEKLVQSDFSWGIQNLGAADHDLLKHSKVPLYQEVYRGLDQCPNLDACLTRARDTNYAFITWRLYMEDRIAIKFTSSTGEPQLHVATQDFFPSEIGWAMNPGCPFRHKFNNQIRRLLEAGLISKWLKQIIHDPKRREADDTQESLLPKASLALGLDQVQGVFYVLFIGCILAVIILGMEACWSRGSKNNA